MTDDSTLKLLIEPGRIVERVFDDQTRCRVCGKNNADRLCDGFIRRRLPKSGSFYTVVCSMPLCGTCSVSSPIFFCGKNGGAGTSDFGPQCMARKNGGPPPKPNRRPGA